MALFVLANESMDAPSRVVQIQKAAPFARLYLFSMSLSVNLKGHNNKRGEISPHHSMTVKTQSMLDKGCLSGPFRI